MKQFSAFLLLFIYVGISSAVAQEVLKVDLRPRPPEMVREKGKFSGPLIDIVNELAKRTGCKVEYNDRQFNGSLTLLQKGDIDLLPRTFWTKERAKLIDFLGPIGYEDKEILFLVKPGKEKLINKYEDLVKLTVGVKNGTVYFDRFDKDGDIKKIESLDDENMVKMFKNDKFDTLITIDKEALEAALKKNNITSYAYASYRLTSRLGIYYGIAPNHKLKSDLQKNLEEMVKTGVVKSIYTSYGLPAPLSSK